MEGYSANSGTSGSAMSSMRSERWSGLMLPYSTEQPDRVKMIVLSNVDASTRPAYRVKTETLERQLVTDKNCLDVSIVGDRVLVTEQGE